MNRNCCVYHDFNRPDPTLIERFRAIPVANLDDCMGRLAAVYEGIKPVGKSGLLGPALTVKVSQGDNLMLHYAMDLAKEGDVLVIDAGGFTGRAIFGGLMVNYLLHRKIAGIVVDGAIRDLEEIVSTGLPVYARGVSPNGPWKNGPGEVNTPVQIGGQLAYPGDIVVGDADGVLFVRPQEAAALLERAEKVVAAEDAVLERIRKDGSMSRPWVMEKLTALNCQFNDFWKES